MQGADPPPPGFVRFNMVRNVENPDEVICFGFFDGTPEQLRASASTEGYEKQLAAVAALVESVGTDGLFEVVKDMSV